MKPTLLQIMIVAGGGAAGSVLRYLTGFWFAVKQQSIFPWATFTVNISGSFIIGLVFGLLSKYNSPTDNWRLLLATGFCGGFTTFSAMSNEGYLLLRQQQYTTFFIYFSTTIVLGLLATALGYFLTK